MFKTKYNRMKLAIILGIVFLLSLTTYYTYSYFTLEVSGNESAKDIITTTATLELTYDGTDSVGLYHAMPGSYVSKTFTVENTGTLDATYDVLWKDVVNRFEDKGDLLYSISCESSVEDSTCGEITSQVQVPNTTSSQEIIKNIDIVPREIHTYTLTISFPYKDEDQNDNQGKSLTANIQINEYSKPTIEMDVQDGTSDKIRVLADYGSNETFTITPDAGYLLENMNVSCNNGTSYSIVNNQITVGPVYLSTSCNVTFAPSYNIHGYVFDQDDRPVSGATVEVHSSVRTAVTDSTGYFELNSVVTGDHQIIVIKDEETFHNSTFSITKGESINIAGNTITGVNPTNPIKIRIKINDLNNKIIVLDRTYRISLSAVNGRVSKDLDIVESGEDSTVTVTPDTGYELTNVSCTNGVDGSWSNNTFTVTRVGNDTTCTIGFGAETYELSMISNTSQGVMYKNVVYNDTYGELPTLSKDNYEFNGWYTQEVGGTQVTADTIVTIPNDHSIYAHFTSTSFDVVYNCIENGGTCSIPNENIPYLSSIDLTKSAVKEGYEFLGWNTDKDATTILSSSIMDTEGKTLYAIFRKNISVNYHGNGSTLSKESDSCTIYNKTSSCTFTSPNIIRDDFIKVGFNENQDSNSSILNTNTIYTITVNRDYYAITYRDISGTFYLNGNTNIKHSGTTYTDNSNQIVLCRINNSNSSCNATSPSITPHANTSNVLGWSNSTNNRSILYNSNAAMNNLNSDVTLYAQTTNSNVRNNITYLIGTGVESIGGNNDYCTINATYNGVLRDTSCTVTSPTITAKTGYNNTYWTNDISATSGIVPGNIITISSDESYTAKSNDTTKPLCSFGTSTSLIVGGTSTIDLTCTDEGSKLINQTLSATNFEISNQTKASINGISAPTSVTNGYKYTITLIGIADGTFTLKLKANALKDNSNNYNEVTTSTSIVVSDISLSPNSATAYLGEGSLTSTIGGSGYGSLSCLSTSSSIATCSISGTTLTINPVTIGSTTIKVRGSSEAEATYTISVKGTIAAPNDSLCKNLTYNGTNQVLTTNSPANYTYLNNTKTNAGTYTITASLNENYSWIDHSSNDITFNCDINPKSIVISSGSSTREYNGTALTNSNCTASLLSGHTITCNNSGTITDAGSVENTISSYSIKDSSSNEVKSNYQVSFDYGTLEVTRKKVDIPTNEYCKILTYTGVTQVLTNLPGEGYSFAPTTGKYATIYSISSILDSNHQWSDSTIENKRFNCIINKRDITYTSGSGSKTYDGAPLTNNGCAVTSGTLISGNIATCNISGSITDKGSVTNTLTSVTIKNSSDIDVTSNYNITLNSGSLVINARNVSYTSYTDSKTYDGTPLSNNSSCTLTSGSLVGSHTATCSNSGTITNVGSTSNTLNSVIIKNGSIDVSDNYNITKNNGTLSITARSITLKSGSKSKQYDGTALTDSSCNVTSGSLVSGHSFTCNNSGSITNVGSVSNPISTYTILNGSTNVNDNYNVTKSSGTLTITGLDMTGGSVSISGTKKTGQVLTANITAPSPTPSSYTYQWWYSTSSSATSGNAINGETSNTYLISDDMYGYYIGVTVTAKKANYNNRNLNGITTSTMADGAPPLMTVMDFGNYTWEHSVSPTVLVYDYEVGMNYPVTVKYGWSDSSSTPPSTYTNYTLTGGVATFNAPSPAGIEGYYYLWVSPVGSLCDAANNCISTAVQSAAPFMIDDKGPSCALDVELSGRTVTTTINDVVDDYSGYSYSGYGFRADEADDFITDNSNQYTFYSVDYGEHTAGGYVTDNLGNEGICTSDYNIEIYNLKSAMLDSYTPIADSASMFTNVSYDSGLYYTSDLSKTEDFTGDGIGERVYYFKGNPRNYVIFAGYCWRVIRTNEDDSVRLLYYGTRNGYSCSSTPTSIWDGTFNESYNNADVAYMYGDNTSTYSGITTNTNDSEVKDMLDAWYSGTVASKSICYQYGGYSPCDYSYIQRKLIDNDEYIANAIYCNDRSLQSGTGAGTTNTVYKAYNRLVTNKTPQFKCPQNNDKFTLSVANGGTSGFGNNALTYPIGMITADELAYAGYVYNKTTSNGILLDDSSIYLITMTPFNLNSSMGKLFSLNSGKMFNMYGSEGGHFLPVISIKKTAPVLYGEGSSSSPWMLE